MEEMSCKLPLSINEEDYREELTTLFVLTVRRLASQVSVLAKLQRR
jgi:hypothetical protein